MGCSACGVSCDSPCAIICYSDCSVCWVDAPVMKAKMVVDIASDVLNSGRELKLTGSTQVRFCCNDMPTERLVDFLNLAYPEARIAKTAAEAKTLTQTLTGTLDEVIKEIGLQTAAR